MLSEAQRTEVISAARRGAYDYYLSALLAPVGSRDDQLVLAAFEGELVRIIETVGEPILAEIRLQWWRDTIAAMAERRGPPNQRSGHAIADALAVLVEVGRVSMSSLHQSIDARSADTGTEPIVSEEDLERYLDQTDGAALERAIAVAAAATGGPEPDRDLVQAAGRCVGLARILLDMPRRHAMGQVPLLAGLSGQTITACGVCDDDAGTAEQAEQRDEQAAQCRKYLAEAALHLGTVRRGWARLPRGQRAALGPVALVGPYLRALQRRGCLGPHPQGVITPVFRVARLWWAVRFARL